MNLGRTLYNYDLIPKIVVDPYWLLGFIEAEGTFGFKNLSPYFFFYSPADLQSWDKGYLYNFCL